jgi:proline-specific peptidase
MAPTIKEGTVSFEVPSAGKPCETWYKIVGDLSSNITPLVTIHGGPGMSHDYMLQLSDLNELYGIPVIFYDQIGCARSTHLREKHGDESFWVEQLFYDELNNLISKLGLVEKGYDVLGHSWGGMVGSTWAGTKPKGLRKLIISNSPATYSGWTDAYSRYLEEMDEPEKSIIKKAEETEKWGGEELEAAMMVFMKKHSTKSMPPEFFKSFDFVKEDTTVSDTM